MKRAIVFLVFALLFALPIGAQSDYETHYENSGAADLENDLDEGTRIFFNENGIDAQNPTWVNNLTKKGVLSHIWQFVTSGAKLPIKTGVLIASIIFLAASFTAFGTTPQFETAIYAAVLVVSALIMGSIASVISTAVNAIKGCSSFMISFVPVFATVVALSGKTVTAPAMSALLLGAAQTVSFVSSFAVLPLMGGYLALSIGANVSPLTNGSAMVESIKKLSVWIISLLSTLFVGVLGIQTVVNSAADSVTLRTTKFILGTSVPIVGGALSEAVSTVSASLGLLRASIGIYGVVAIAFILLPIVVELILWRVMLMLDISLSELFSLSKITGILKAVDTMLGLLIGIILMIGGMFIVSLAVVMSASKG